MSQKRMSTLSFLHWFVEILWSFLKRETYDFSKLKNGHVDGGYQFLSYWHIGETVLSLAVLYDDLVGPVSWLMANPKRVVLTLQELDSDDHESEISVSVTNISRQLFVYKVRGSEPLKDPFVDFVRRHFKLGKHRLVKAVRMRFLSDAHECYRWFLSDVQAMHLGRFLIEIHKRSGIGRLMEMDSKERAKFVEQFTLLL
ncbi:MAG: hypothetical protein ABIH21_01115 [Patescibacteria group bacterium]